MSSRRIPYLKEVPYAVRRAFRCADEPHSVEERLWRERAARMVLDAVGLTCLIGKRKKHNDAVGYARRWLKGFYDTPDTPPELWDSARGTFDAGGINYEAVAGPILATKPILVEDSNDRRGTA